MSQWEDEDGIEGPWVKAMEEVPELPALPKARPQPTTVMATIPHRHDPEEAW